MNSAAILGASTSRSNSRSESGAPAIELRGVHKHFTAKGATVRAVDGIDLTIERGEVVAVLGANGAGKTTTLDMVIGLSEPTTGTVRTFGAHPRESVIAGSVGAVLQSGGLLDDLTVGETVRLVASLHGREVGTPARVAAVMERAGLTPLRNRRVLRCSGGEQQRVRFALALLPDPDLLVLDEPTAGMDVGARRDFWAQMHADADAGRTIVFATHYLEEAEHFARRIVFVADGRIVADGTVADLRGRSRTRTVSADLAAGTRDAVHEAMRRLGVAESDLTWESGTGAGHPAESAGFVDTPSDAPSPAVRLTVRCPDSDAVARALLDLDATEIEVSRGSLDAGFLDMLTTHETETIR